MILSKLKLMFHCSIPLSQFKKVGDLIDPGSKTLNGYTSICHRNPVLKRLKMWNASTEEKQSQYLFQDNISDNEESLPSSSVAFLVSVG